MRKGQQNKCGKKKYKRKITKDMEHDNSRGIEEGQLG